MAELDPANPCFGCGGGSPQGMRLVFDRDEAKRRILGRFRLGAEFQGGIGFIHGGIIATVLDEAMGKVCRFSDVRAVTAELNIQFLRPIRVGEAIHVEAFEESRNGRHLINSAEIRNGNGEVLSKGRGRFVIIDLERFRV
ncbi:MAG: PaaI family thioesterase [Acidobacteria bacterium]|nr:PaaI family thioesterase [Acidobacteriota bacterium]